MTDFVYVGIPTLNGPHRLLRGLKSIFDDRNTGAEWYPRMRVMVADDGSTEHNLKLNKDVITQCPPDRGPRVEMLHGHGRTGIASAWNRLVRFSYEWVPQGQDISIVLINDDIEVVPHWVDVLDYSLRHNPHAGMVGLNSYLSVTREQVRVEGRTPMTVDYCEAHLLGGGGTLLASTGSIFGFRRSAWEEVGGFDERYFVFFEEVDFGAEQRRRGRWCYMASYPLCYHTGGETNSDPANLSAGERLAESRDRFVAKWGRGPDALREDFMLRQGPPPACREWNTMLKNLRG